MLPGSGVDAITDLKQELDNAFTAYQHKRRCCFIYRNVHKVFLGNADWHPAQTLQEALEQLVEFVSSDCKAFNQEVGNHRDDSLFATDHCEEYCKLLRAVAYSQPGPLASAVPEQLRILIHVSLVVLQFLGRHVGRDAVASDAKLAIVRCRAASNPQLVCALDTVVKCCS